VCPQVHATDVGINAAVSVQYAEALDSTSASPNSIRLICGDTPIAGTVMADGWKLRFIPDAPLPANVECHAEVDQTALRDMRGARVMGATWAFETGSSEKEEWHLAGEVLAGTGVGNLRALYAGTRPVTVGARRHEIYVNSSSDGGATFSPTVSIATPDSYGLNVEHDAMYSNGRLHVAWRFLPYSTFQSDILYSQSTPDLSSFTEPLYLMPPYDGQQTFSPSLATDKNGTTVLAWNSGCDYHVPDCSSEGAGTHLASLHPDGTHVLLDRLLSPGGASPTPVGFDDGQAGSDGLMAAWLGWRNYEYHLDVVIPSENSQPLATVSGQGGPFQFVRLDSQRGVLHWQEVDADGGRSFYLADVDAVAKTVGTARLLMSHRAADYQYYCSHITTNGAGLLAWRASGVLNEEAPSGKTRPTEGAIHISRDGGTTFGDPIPLDFLLPPFYSYEVGQVYDGWCPAIALSETEQLLVAWRRETDGGPEKVVMTRVGSSTRPCMDP